MIKAFRIITGGLIATFALVELLVTPAPSLPSYASLLLLFTAGMVTGD